MTFSTRLSKLLDNRIENAIRSLALKKIICSTHRYTKRPLYIPLSESASMLGVPLEYGWRTYWGKYRIMKGMKRIWQNFFHGTRQNHNKFAPNRYNLMLLVPTRRRIWTDRAESELIFYFTTRNLPEAYKKNLFFEDSQWDAIYQMCRAKQDGLTHLTVTDNQIYVADILALWYQKERDKKY